MNSLNERNYGRMEMEQKNAGSPGKSPSGDALGEFMRCSGWEAMQFAG